MSRARSLLVALLAAVALPSPAEPPKARKVAFLVGVGEFKHDLDILKGSPQKDVAALADALRGGAR